MILRGERRGSEKLQRNRAQPGARLQGKTVATWRLRAGCDRVFRDVRTATRSHKGSHFLPPFFHSQLKVIWLPPSCTVTVARVCASVKLQTRPSTLAR